MYINDTCDAFIKYNGGEKPVLLILVVSKLLKDKSYMNYTTTCTCI